MTGSPWDEGDPDYAETAAFLSVIDGDEDFERVDLDDTAPTIRDVTDENGSAKTDSSSVPLVPGRVHGDGGHEVCGDHTGSEEFDGAMPKDDDAGEVIPFDDPDTFDAAHATSGPRYNRPVVIGFLCCVAVATIGLAATMVGMQPASHVDTAEVDNATPRSEPAPVSAIPPIVAPTPPPSADAPIPYQASSPCPPGSTSAQNVAANDPSRAWVCVRGGGDGQVLTLDLGAPMKVTAVSITPGWIGADNNGIDQWLAHRILTRVQWILINGEDRTPVLQDTNNIHGDALQPMPSRGNDQGVLASRIEMIVLQTSRPPVDVPNPTGTGAAPPGGRTIDSVLGAPLGPAAPQNGGSPEVFDNTLLPPNGDDTDPVDNTFAVSAIKVLGHPPQ